MKNTHLNLLLTCALLTACSSNLPIPSAQMPAVTDSGQAIATADAIAQATAAAKPTAEQNASAKQAGGQGKKPKTSPPAASQAEPPTLESLNIVLGSVTDSSVLLSLLSPTAGDVVIAYGTDASTLVNQTAATPLQAMVPQTIQLSGLSPNSAYFYKASIQGQAASETHSFHTQRPAGASFTFSIDADPHYQDPRFDAAVYAHSLENAKANQPDLHINLGDTFMTEKGKPATLEDVENTFSGMRPSFGVLAADVPLFLVNGNHEAELGWLANSSQQEIALWSVQARQRYYPNPRPGSFYSGSASTDPLLGTPRDGFYAFTWGNALFVMLDPFWYTTKKPQAEDPQSNWNWTLGEEQYRWLQETLQTSDARFKFVFIHHLVGGAKDARGGVEVANLYEWGGKNADGSDGFAEHRPGWEMPIHQLLVKNNVSAVFHGHDHVYVQQELDGIIYQELPQASLTENGKADLASEAGYISGTSAAGAGILLVTVTPESAQAQYLLTEPTTGYQANQTAPKIAAQYVIQPALGQ